MDDMHTYKQAMRDMNIAVDCMLLCLPDASRNEFTLRIQEARLCLLLSETTLSSLNILVDEAVGRVPDDSVRVWWRRMLEYTRKVVCQSRPPRLHTPRVEPISRYSDVIVAPCVANARVAVHAASTGNASATQCFVAGIQQPRTGKGGRYVTSAARVGIDTRKLCLDRDRVNNQVRYAKDAPVRAEFTRRRKMHKDGAVVPAAVTTIEKKADRMLVKADAYNTKRKNRMGVTLNPSFKLKVGDRVEVLFPKLMYMLPEISTGYKATVSHVVEFHGYLVELDDAAALEIVRSCHLKTSRHIGVNRTFPAHLMQCGHTRLRLMEPVTVAAVTVAETILPPVSVAMLLNHNSTHLLPPLAQVIG